MSRKTQTLLSMLLVLVFLFSVITGCSSSDGTKDSNVDQPKETGEQGQEQEQEEEPVEEEPKYDFGGRTITYAAYWDPEPKPGGSEYEDKIIERTKDLEEKYNFKLEYLNVPSDQFTETFTASTLAGDPFAELAMVQTYWFFPGLVVNGFCYPVSDLGIFDFQEEKWNKQLLEAGTYEGKIYSMNTGKLFPRGGIYWNKTIFEREGLPNLYELQNNKTWTWDKMLEIAKKATKDLDGDGTVDQWGIVGATNSPWPFVYSNGGRLYEMVDGRAIFRLNEPNAVEAFQFVQDLINVHKVMPMIPDDGSWDWAMNQFQAGIAAMEIGEWWETDRFQPNMADDYGFVVFPIGPKGDGYTSVISMENLLVMPATVDKPEEVAIFWDEYTEPFPDEDPESWLEDHEKRARDAESVETIKMIVEGKEVKSLMNYTQILGDNVGWLTWNALKFVGTGEKTAAVAIQEIEQAAQAALDDVFVK